MKKRTKNKKVKVNQKTPFDFGLDAEQSLADALCDKYLQVGVEVEAIDDAFIGAFHGFAHRMLTIFKKDFVLNIIEEMSEIVEEEENKPYVCPDCEEKHNHTPIVVMEADKGKVH